MEIEDDDKHLLINVPLMKITGLYQIISPYSSKICGLNIFKCMIVIQIVIFVLADFWFLFNIIYCKQDIYAMTHFLYLFQSGISSIFKQYCLVKNSDVIWNCVQMTSINRLTYKYHRRQILEDGRSKSKYYSTLFASLWFTVVIAWMLAPFSLIKYYMEVKIDDQLYHYRYNVLNLIFPAVDTFYNDNFIMYFIVESIIAMIWGHGTLIFDVFLISMCTIFSYELKTIANSYSTLGTLPDHLTNNAGKMSEQEELLLLYNYKVLIEDQQKVVQNLRNIYKIFQPVTLLQIFGDSLNTILLLSAIMMNSFNGLSLGSPINLRFMVSIITQLMHLFINCYLFSHVDTQKDSLNFALYCSDWTAKSIRFKKMLLYSMRMNSADYCKLQFSRGRIVNFEMFASIMRTCYSILSVLSKMYSEKK